jgi:uncharacterized protein
MTLIYDLSVPVAIHGLKSLSALLVKAEAHCVTKNIKPEALLQFRLFPDMFPLSQQIQLTSDFGKGLGARLSGTPNPSFVDEEKTFEELQARIAKTITFLQSLDKSLFADAATREVTVRVSRTEEKTMSGAAYLSRAALPNFYFHLATAYNILRHNGLDVGKGDYMGRNI